VNFLRMHWPHEVVEERYVKVPKEKQPPGVLGLVAARAIDMHVPERWGTVRFVE
jgi:hypothetical protein